MHTAGEGVLEGTVRRLLLEVCAREDIPVVLSPPNLNDIDSWQARALARPKVRQDPRRIHGRGSVGLAPHRAFGRAR